MSNKTNMNLHEGKKQMMQVLRSAPNEAQEEGSLRVAVLLHDFPEPAHQSAVRLDPFVSGDRLEKSERDVRRPADHGLELGSREQREERQRDRSGQALAHGVHLGVEFVQAELKRQFQVRAPVVRRDAPVNGGQGHFLPGSRARREWQVELRQSHIGFRHSVVPDVAQRRPKMTVDFVQIVQTQRKTDL